MILQQDQEAPQEQVRRKALWHFATASPGVAALAPGPHWQAPAQGREVLSPAIACPPFLARRPLLFDSVTGQACQDEPSLLTKKENHTKKRKLLFSSSKQKKTPKKKKKRKKKTPPTLVLRGLTNGLFFFFLLSPHLPSTSSFVPY